MTGIEATPLARPLVLASVSPRRKVLLRAAGLSFESIAPQVDELVEGEPRAMALENACRKARAVAGLRPEAWVLAADTVVVLGDRAFGKPADLAGARAMLEALAGRTHEVATAVCLRCEEVDREETFLDVSRVTMRPADPDRIEEYLERVDTLDKAGAYAIQKHGHLVVESHDGDFTTIVGLPMRRLTAVLRELE